MLAECGRSDSTLKRATCFLLKQSPLRCGELPVSYALVRNEL
jgi:hypothetical protein